MRGYTLAILGHKSGGKLTNQGPNSYKNIGSRKECNRGIWGVKTPRVEKRTDRS